MAREFSFNGTVNSILYSLTFRFLRSNVIGCAIFNAVCLNKCFASCFSKALSASRLIFKRWHALWAPGCLREEHSVHTLPSVGGWSWETAKLAAKSSKIVHSPMIKHVISPGAKTFATVGWPGRQQYLLIDSRQEVVQCTCRVWILYKGNSYREVLPKFQTELVAQSPPSPQLNGVCV